MEFTSLLRPIVLLWVNFQCHDEPLKIVVWRMGVPGQTLIRIKSIEKNNRKIKDKKLFGKIKGYAATLKVTQKNIDNF